MRSNSVDLGLLTSLRKVRVNYKDDERIVTCFCGDEVKRSLVPHLKKEHRQLWEDLVGDFVRLAEEGKSYRWMMNSLSDTPDTYLLSWTVIKREVRKRVEGQEMPLKARPRPEVRTWNPEVEIRPDSTIWEFPRRGDWAVHSPDYDGNWSPYVPRELLLRYSQKYDLVADPFAGGGTTLIECALLGRRAIGVDISPHAINHINQRLRELKAAAGKALERPFDLNILDNIRVEKGDARVLSFIDDESVDLICTHPPYGPAIRYTESVENDLSRIDDPMEFRAEFRKVVHEFSRILKPGKRCAFLIGDYRRHKHIVPLGWMLFSEMVDSKIFQPEEIVIKKQFQDSSTEFYWGKEELLRYRIAHEYLFIFRKTD
jgi:SAM-dependent methyltransferase